MASKSKTKTDVAPAVDYSNLQTNDTDESTDESNSKSVTATAIKKTESKSKASESRSIKSHKLMMKAAELAERKRKEREAHPERMKYFLPRVYETWEDDSAIDEELKEQEKMMKEIKEIEELLQKKKDAGALFDSQDEEKLIELKAVYNRLKTRKKPEALHQKRLEDQLERGKKERALKDAERVYSELLNPSKYGWYYGDGYYNTSENLFGLNDTLVEKFQVEQDVFIEKGRKKNSESFSDKFKRNFWPPKLLFKGKIPLFRTRGIYLDFPEVEADLSHSVGLNYERNEQVFFSKSLFKGEEIDENHQKPEGEESDAETESESECVTGGGDESKSGKKKGKGKKKTWKIGKKKAMINTGWDQWYYDDEAGEVFPKREEFTCEYYMDGVNICWRHQRPPRLNFKRQPTPYDWYYDVNKGQVLARADYLGFDEFEYDHKLGVFLLKNSKELKKLKAKSSRFGIFGRKQKKVNAYEQPSIPPSKRPVTDFYFDEKFGCWLPKDEPKPDPDEPGVIVEPFATNLTENAEGSGEAEPNEPVAPEEPSVDIVWDENGHRFTRKWEGEWRGLTGQSPDDYYFDDDKGLFLPKPPRQDRLFKYHPCDGVWRNGNVPAPNKLRHQLKNVLAPSDYYFDNLQGQFLPKNVDKGARYNYWLQKYSRTWRKHLEPKTGMYPEDFYWDVERKLWLHRSTRMEMMKNAQSLRNKGTNEIIGVALRQARLPSDTPNDYF